MLAPNLLETEIEMKKRHMILGLFCAVCLAGCGNAEDDRFQTQIDNFCTEISELDTSINNIDVSAEGYTTELLGYLDELDTEFQTFAQIDFPKKFDYLEELADESSEYMTEAVKSYHEAYADNYDEATAGYALENYSRAYKRVQIIISFLHGETPEDVDVATEAE